MPPEMFSMRGDAHKYGSEVFGKWLLSLVYSQLTKLD